MLVNIWSNTIIQQHFHLSSGYYLVQLFAQSFQHIGENVDGEKEAE